MKPTLVLCLGNEVLSDDALGFVVAEKLNGIVNDEVEITFAPVAGFNLLDLLNNRKKVLIVDSILTGTAKPGTIHFFPAGHMTPTNGLINSHQISLPTALKLSKTLGYNLPDNIDILAVEIKDNTTLSEQLTSEVARAVDPVVNRISKWIEEHNKELVYG